MVEIKEQENTYRLTNGSEVFDTKKMTEEEFKKANAMVKFMTGGKTNPWFWEKVN